MGSPADMLATLRKSGFSALADAIPLEVVASVMGAAITHKQQPLLAILHGTDRHANPHRFRVVANTSHAIHQLALRPVVELCRWLDQKIVAAADLGDYANAASALAEIRAIGALVEAGAVIAPVPPVARKRTPDFRLTEATDEWFVEVHAKQMEGKEATRLRQFHEGKDEGRHLRRNGVTIREHVVQPAGARSGDETVAENVASKFARIKADAGQATGTAPALLWIDVQDEDWWFLHVDDAEPVTLAHEEFTSSGFWHAFYGRTGSPLFEHKSLDERVIDNVERMRFDGLFVQAPAWSGAVLSFSDGVVLFENVTSERRLTLEMRERLVRLSHFDLARSWLDWPPGARSLLDRLSDEHARLEALAQRARYSW